MNIPPSINAPMNFPAINSLVPHRAGMLLIDEVIASDSSMIKTRAVVRENSIFCIPGFGIPGWVGFEMMAQTISAYDGMRSWRSGLAPKLGFLIGCRHYQCTTEWLAPNLQLEFEATPLLEDGETMAFACKMSLPTGEQLANGQLNVYQPNDLAGFLSTTNSR